MKSMKTWCLAYSFWLLALGSATHADASVIADSRVDTCNACTAQQVEARAAQRFVESRVEVHVLDYVSRLLWTCEVVRERELMVNVVACGPGSPQAQATFREVADLVVALKDTVEIPYPGGNIYEIAGCPACGRQWLFDNRYSLARQISLADLLAAAGLRFSAQIGVPVFSVSASYEGQVRVKIVLANDSANAREKGFCIGHLTNTELVVDVNQCVDGDGNPIPTLANPIVQNRYQFVSAVNHQNMVGRLRAIGRPVRGGGRVTVRPIVIECTGSECVSDGSR